MTAIIDGEKEFNSRDATPINVSGGDNTRVFRGFENRLGKTALLRTGYSTVDNTSVALGAGQELSFEERVQNAIRF